MNTSASTPRRRIRTSTGLLQLVIGDVVVAEADRFYQSQGASLSGWVITRVGDVTGDYSHPLPTRAAARRALLVLDVNAVQIADAAESFPNV